ncbi:MAG: indole-3-glycerol phosphate synthase TrpC [Armatimonadetes bacterium]|nr:indole-3-glycerol phosphate synthase TrpC [Armatimonadota bacterium]
MNILQQIFETKREEVADAKRRVTLSDLKSQISEMAATKGFLAALEEGRKDDLSLIAEVKAASPSAGDIRPDIDPERVAIAYEEAGVHALSVLTDERFFKGSKKNLEAARRISNLPILRKDFLEVEYQIYEARAWGADAVLLITAFLEISQLADLQALAAELGLDSLVEIHDERELDKAMEVSARLIGINNRNLVDFQTDIAVSERLLPKLPKEAFGVSESALKTRKDLERVKVAGAKGVLIGTTFCEAEDIGAKVREVMGWASE